MNDNVRGILDFRVPQELSPSGRHNTTQTSDKTGDSYT